MNKTAKHAIALLLAALLLIGAPSFALSEEVHQHFFVTKTEQAATCTETGYRWLSCACGETREEQIDPLGHAWEDVEQAPTCSSAGFTGKRCARCGMADGEETPALGHDYGPWEIISNDCTEGLQQRVCSRCGMVHNQDYRGDSHTWGEWIVTVSPTADQEGEKTRTCEKCGVWETESVPKREFVFGSQETQGLTLKVELASSAVIGFRAGDVARFKWSLVNTSGMDCALNAIACTQNSYSAEDSGFVDVPVSGEGGTLTGTASVTIATVGSGVAQMRIVFQAYFTLPDGSAGYTNQVTIVLPVG